MSKVLDLLFAVVVAVVVIAAFCLGGYIVYLWFYGLTAGLEHYMSIPIWLGVILLLLVILIIGPPSAIFLGAFGVWTAINVLSWPWYGAVALYLPLIGIWVSVALFGASLAAVLALGNKLIEVFSPPNRRR